VPSKKKSKNPNPRRITSADINAKHEEFWNDEARHLEHLRQRYPDAHTHRIVEAARVIADASTLETGRKSYSAAVRAAEALEGVSKRINAAGRQRAAFVARKWFEWHSRRSRVESPHGVPVLRRRCAPLRVDALRPQAGAPADGGH
jgi:hypothetical protein